MSLATIWCFASGYLSFFFTDCLMSRWLLNYTPQATIIRLLTINALNAYITSIVLYWTGGFSDPRLFLPGWISIATVWKNHTLTVCYHITHSQINIRKETVTSINVFSIGSTITMITLLVHMHTYQSDYPDMPLVVHARRFCEEVSRRIASIETAGRPEL
ncbi:N-glycosylation protein-domain-containing protein [Stachybotrys elegans]|uniref:N-glycosylation protein-domain-containing protein n=1 Tax=Stachybotrys elegans TaxID=80388 RepID=A0A8K0SLE5_9HYPO|nr:N-glycosylation protein-domain-containing protein [Stachybotrys elegans]